MEVTRALIGRLMLSPGTVANNPQIGLYDPARPAYDSRLWDPNWRYRRRYLALLPAFRSVFGDGGATVLSQDSYHWGRGVFPAGGFLVSPVGRMVSRGVDLTNFNIFDVFRQTRDDAQRVISRYYRNRAFIRKLIQLLREVTPLSRMSSGSSSYASETTQVGL